MAVTAAQLLVRVGSDISGLQRGLAQANREIQNATGAMAQRVGAGMSNIGRSMTLGLTLPLTAAGAVMVKTAGTFDKEMRNIQSISRQTDSEIETLGQQFLKLSADISKTTDTPQNLARGYYQIYSAGFEGAKGLMVLEAATKAASAGLTTTDKAAQAITATLNAYSMGAENATFVSDVLFRTVDLGVITFDELATQFGDVVSTAAAAKVPLTEIGAALSIITRGGVPAAEAMTSLNRFLLAFISPSKQAQEVARALGLDLSAAHLQTVGLAQAVQEMNDKTGGSAELLQALVGDVRAFKAVLNLTRDDGKAFNDMLGQFQNISGRTADAFATQTKSFEAQMASFKNAVTVLAIELGSELLPILIEIVNALRPVVAAFAELPSPIKKAIVVVGAILAVLGPLFMVLGPIVSGVGAVAGAFSGLAPVIGAAAAATTGAISAIGAPILALVALVVGAVLAIKNNWLGLGDIFRKVGEFIATVFSFITLVVDTFWKFITGQITWDDLKTIIGGAFERMKNTVAQILEDLKALVADAWNKIVDWCETAASRIEGAFGGIAKWIRGGFKGNPFKEMTAGANAATKAINGTAAAAGKLHVTSAGLRNAGIPNTPTEAGGWRNFMPVTTPSDLLAGIPSLADILGDTISDGATGGVKDAFQVWTDALNSFISSAQGHLRNLAPEGFEAFADPNAPGANGPFEGIYRAMDVAVHGDASQWAAKLGLDQATAAQIVKDFQQGLITEQVKSLIDVPMLTGMVQRQQLGKTLTDAFVADVAKAAGVRPGAALDAMMPWAKSGAAKPAQVTQGATNIATGLTTALNTDPNPTTLMTGGKEMLVDLTQGITDNLQLVRDAATATVQAFLDTIDGFSTAIYDKGMWMIARLAEGLRGNVDTLTQAATDVVNSMMAAMKAAVEEAKPTAPPPPPVPQNSPDRVTQSAMPIAAPPVTVNVYNPTGQPTEDTVMRTLKNLAAVGVLHPV